MNKSPATTDINEATIVSAIFSLELKADSLFHDLECVRQVTLLAYNDCLDNVVENTVSERAMQALHAIDILIKRAGEKMRALSDDLFKERVKRKRMFNFPGSDPSHIKAFRDMCLNNPPEPDLLPCPFCGSEATLKPLTSFGTPGWRVWCSRCKCGTTPATEGHHLQFAGRRDVDITLDEAMAHVIARWNNRVDKKEAMRSGTPTWQRTNYPLIVYPVQNNYARRRSK